MEQICKKDIEKSQIKMKTMEAIHRHLMRVGMTSHQSSKCHPFNTRNSTSLFIFVTSAISAVLYLFYGATNLNEYADTVYLIITATTSALAFASVNWKMVEIFRFIDNLESIINTRLTNSTVKTIYTQTSEKIKKLVEQLDFAFTKVSPICTTIPTFIGCFVAYFTTDVGPDAFELPFPTMWFPFNVKTPIGFSIGIALQFIISVNLCLADVCVLIVLIVPCLVLISTTNDIKYGLSKLNAAARKKENPFKITQQFNRFVQFHSKTKQLANDFSDMVQFIFIIYFVWSIASICLTMFAIKIELHEHAPNSIVFRSVILIIWSFALVFLSCEFGHKLSMAFIEIDHAIDQMAWYKLPNNIRKVLPILMAAAQEPVYLRVFGSKSCARDDFQKVVNCGFSYFMVLKNFGN